MAYPGPYQQQAKPSALQAKESSRMGQNFIPFFAKSTCKMKETSCKKRKTDFKEKSIKTIHV